jgi:hypothetical protein
MKSPGRYSHPKQHNRTPKALNTIQQIIISSPRNPIPTPIPIYKFIQIKTNADDLRNKCNTVEGYARCRWDDAVAEYDDEVGC